MEERTSRSGVEARGQSRGQRKTSRRNSPTNSPVLNPYYPELHVHDTVEETRSKYDVAPVVRITHYQTPGVLQTLKTPIQTVKQVAKRSAPIPGPTGGKHANSTGQRDLTPGPLELLTLVLFPTLARRVFESVRRLPLFFAVVLVLKFSRFLVVRSGARESGLEGAWLRIA
jgi:hypothetical protein